MKYKLLVLYNQLLTPEIASGGDALSTEIISKFDFHLKIISPFFAQKDLKSKIKKAIYISSDNTRIRYSGGFTGGLKILFSYLYRTFKTLFLFSRIGNVEGIYLTGDFFCNSIPAIIYKFFNPKAKIFCNFYHLNPVPWKRENNFVFSSASWVMQHFSLFILKIFGDIFFVLSKEGVEILKKIGVKAGKIEISGAGVSEDFYKIKVNKGYRHCDIIFVGRLNKTKGIYDALHCLITIKKVCPSVKLGVIGASTDTELAKIKNIINKNKLTRNFHYFGYISSEKKIKLMKSTSILIAPSHEEGFGIGVLEGVASGMKVAAYDLPVYRLIFDKYRDKITYAPLGDIQSLSDDIIKLLKNRGENRPVKVSTWEDVAKIQEVVIARNLIK